MEPLHDIHTVCSLLGLRQGHTNQSAPPTELYQSPRQLEIAAHCTSCLLQGDFEACEAFFSTDMRQLLPAEALRRSWEIALEPTGAFQALGKQIRLDPPNMVLHCLHYEKQIVRIRYVFHGEELCGLWTDYASEEPK